MPNIDLIKVARVLQLADQFSGQTVKGQSHMVR